MRDLLEAVGRHKDAKESLRAAKVAVEVVTEQAREAVEAAKAAVEKAREREKGCEEGVARALKALYGELS